MIALEQRYSRVAGSPTNIFATSQFGPTDFFPPFAFRSATVRFTTEVKMSIPAKDTDQQILELIDGEAPNDLAVIREQTFESLQILRNLLSLLMPARR